MCCADEEADKREGEKEGGMLGSASEWLLRRVFRFLVTAFLGKYVKVVDELETKGEEGRLERLRRKRNEDVENEDEDGAHDRGVDARVEGSKAENGAIVLENVVLECDEINEAIRTVRA